MQSLILALLLLTPARWRPAECADLPQCQAHVSAVLEASERAGKEWGVPPALIVAVAWHESKFDPAAVSRTQDWGVWQLNPRSRWGRRAKRWCRIEPGTCLIYQAMEVGFILRTERDRCKTWDRALGAYHTGQCGAGDYSRRVVRKWHRLGRS